MEDISSFWEGLRALWIRKSVARKVIGHIFPSKTQEEMETEKDENSNDEAESIFDDPQDEKGKSKLGSENAFEAPKVTLSSPQEVENESFENELVINKEGELARGTVTLSALQQEFNIGKYRSIEEKLFEEQLRLTGQKEELDKEAARLQVRRTSFNHEQQLFAKERDLEERKKKLYKVEKDVELKTAIALWVKSGNRGNLKCLKVNNHFVLIFHRKIFVSFLSDAKMPKVYD